jgi:hypothetical protein
LKHKQRKKTTDGRKREKLDKKNSKLILKVDYKINKEN